jgi:hypothetical protein
MSHPAVFLAQLAPLWVGQIPLRSPVVLIANTQRLTTIYLDLALSYSFMPLIFIDYFFTD